MDEFDPQFDDLDDVLRRTPTPPDLAARLQASAQAALSDDEIDDSLRDVQLPLGLFSRLIDRSRNELGNAELAGSLSTSRYFSSRTLARAAVWGTAACLLLAASMWRWSALTVDQVEPLAALPANQPSAAPATPSRADEAVAWLGPDSHDIAKLDLSHWLAQPNSPESAFSNSASADSTQPFALSTERISRPAPLDPQLAHLASDLPPNLLADAFLMRWKPLGARPLVDALPAQIFRSPATDRQAQFFPLAPGFDRQFLLREEDQPFVALPNPKLTSIKAPLVASGSWQTTVRQATESSSVASPLRLEKLAALGGHLFIEAERNKIALRTAAGPAVFAPSGLQMLQVGVVSGSADIVDRPPTHLTIAIDLTPQMQRSGRWANVREALSNLVDQMSPYDTVSLVRIDDPNDEHDPILVEEATSADAAAWRETLQQLEPNDCDCLAEGIRFSSAVALRTTQFGDIRRPLIIISDRFDRLGPTQRRELQPLIDDAVSQRVDYHWFVADAHETYRSIPSFWHDRGSVSIDDRELSIRRNLQQIVYGKPTCLGQDVRLTVRWNPKSVSSYRLVGCQPEAAGLGEGQEPLELHGDEAAASLFELTLTPDGPNEVARIEATWQDPATGKSRKDTQIVSRLQFAPSWEASPLSLQAAQLAVQAGGLLTESYFVRQRGGDAGELLAIFQRANRQLSRRSDFAYLEQLVRATERRRTNGF
ncbi:MAG: hypothetical protein ACIALR_15770 [Blastopirellula sp. JB062]